MNINKTTFKLTNSSTEPKIFLTSIFLYIYNIKRLINNCKNITEYKVILLSLTKSFKSFISISLSKSGKFPRIIFINFEKYLTDFLFFLNFIFTLLLMTIFLIFILKLLLSETFNINIDVAKISNNAIM
ncbi:hypothetical protein D3C81_1508640 [compost metagenome]